MVRDDVTKMVAHGELRGRNARPLFVERNLETEETSESLESLFAAHPYARSSPTPPPGDDARRFPGQVTLVRGPSLKSRWVFCAGIRRRTALPRNTPARVPGECRDVLIENFRRALNTAIAAVARAKGEGLTVIHGTGLDREGGDWGRYQEVVDELNRRSKSTGVFVRVRSVELALREGEESSNAAVAARNT